MLLNQPHRKLGQSSANCWHKDDQPAKKRQAWLVLLCATLTPLKQAARKLPVQSIPLALRVKFTFYWRWTFNNICKYFNTSFFFFFLWGSVCLSNPTSPLWSSIGLVPCLFQCVSAYKSSSPALKGVTRGMDILYFNFNTSVLSIA